MIAARTSVRIGIASGAMPREALLVGGPYDGATLTARKRNDFIYIGGDDHRPKTYVREGKGRCLYRRFTTRDEFDLFLVAAHTHVQCPACEAWTARGARCQGCGESLALA